MGAVLPAVVGAPGGGTATVMLLHPGTMPSAAGAKAGPRIWLLEGENSGALTLKTKRRRPGVDGVGVSTAERATAPSSTVGDMTRCGVAG